MAAFAPQAFAACSYASDGFNLDWNSTSWTVGSSSRTVNAKALDTARSSDPVSFAFTGNTERYLSGYPVVNATFTGNHGGRAYSLAYAVDFSSNSQSVFLTINFTKAVENLSFEMLDVDALEATNGSGGFRDGLKITGTGSTGTVLPALSKSSSSSIYLGSPLASNWALGYYFNASNSVDGTLFVNFAQPVTRVVIEYTNGIYAPSSNPSAQGVALYDLNYCVSRTANVQTSKTQSVYGETAANCGVFPGTPDAKAEHALPGSCIEYKISANNSGDGAAENISLIDRLNPNLIFVNATQTGFGSSGTGLNFSAPAPYQDCTSGSCTISLSSARLQSAASGQILIRAIVK